MRSIIDGGYIKEVLKQFDYAQICYAEFSKLLAEEDEILRTYYYDCPPYVSGSPTKEERKRKQAFDRFKFSLQREHRFQVKLGRLARRHTKKGEVYFEQKEVDILLAVDLVQLSLRGAIQRAILVRQRDLRLHR